MGDGVKAMLPKEIERDRIELDKISGDRRTIIMQKARKIEPTAIGSAEASGVVVAIVQSRLIIVRSTSQQI